MEGEFTKQEALAIELKFRGILNAVSRTQLKKHPVLLQDADSILAFLAAAKTTVEELREAERRMRRLAVALLALSSPGGEMTLSDDIFEDGVDCQIDHRIGGHGCWTFFVVN